MPPKLTAIHGGLAADGPTPAHGGAWIAGIVCLVVAVLASLSGADRARAPSSSTALAEEALRAALERGNEDPEVRAGLAELRARVAREPLDSRSRVAYAGLLLAVATDVDDTERAASHARRAAELAPVTVPVVRAATRVLARAGQDDDAAELVRHMFSYDPPAAARLLSRIEPGLGPATRARAVPDEPVAAHAWYRQLRSLGRDEEASGFLESAVGRWPRSLPLLEARGTIAVHAHDWRRLAELFPDDVPLPPTREATIPKLLRARLHAERGKPDATVADVESALQTAPDSIYALLLAGDALEAAGRTAEARHRWQRGRFLARSDSDRALRIELLSRLARWEERYGEPAAALRLWESVLELDPENVQAAERRRAWINPGG